MSTIVVTPPAAAACVAVSNPSHSVRPGSFTCTCESTTPGMSVSSPKSVDVGRVVEVGDALDHTIANVDRRGADAVAA